MEDTPKSNKGLIFLGVMAILLFLTFIIPARYVGLAGREAPLILKNENDLSSLSGDKNNNSVPDWRDLALSSISSSTQDAMATADPSAQKTLDDPNNLTASFSKNVYISSAYANQNGNISQADQEALVASLLDAEGGKIVVKTYTLSDLTINKKETPSSIKEYGNALGLLLKKADTYKLGSSDIDIMKAYNTNGDDSVLQSLVIKKNNLTTILNALLKMSVPLSATPYHLMMVNKISNYKVVLENMAQAKTDPVRATLAFNSYELTIRELISSISTIEKYFMVGNVIFTKNEPGFILTSGYTQ